MDLDSFVLRIPNFDSLSASERIPFFVFYLTFDADKPVLPKDIEECFDKLCILPYSNIRDYLRRKSTGKDAIFLKNQNGYRLNRATKASIATIVQEPILKPPSNDLLPLSIFNNTPYYIGKIASHMCLCYDTGLYDACLVMMRKLTETLIIECFERHGIDNQIKDKNGNFLYLSDLIPLFVSCNSWNASVNLKNNIKNRKKIWGFERT